MIPTIRSTDLAYEQLTKQFEILCYIDLAEVSKTPDYVYKIFNTHRRDAYTETQRLVFYTSHDVSDALVEHIKIAADLIDISSYFILIYRVETPTDQLHNTYAVPDSICPFPWTHLEIKANGQIFPCCVYSESIGNINQVTLTDAFNGEYMTALRQQFKDGAKPNGCSNCWRNESQGLVSNRQRHNNFLKKELLINYFDRPTIASLDIKPGNVCNFKCRICSPGSSSLFAQEVISNSDDEDRKKIILTNQKLSKWTEDDQIFDQLKELIPTLSNLDMYGGEPFLVKQLTSVLNYAVENNYASQIRLHYNTNGSIFPEQLVPLWQHFKEIDIAVSIDNIGKRFELERGGLWSEIETNIQKLVALQSKKINVYIMPTINIQNVYYLDELFAWADKFGLEIRPLILKNPAGYSIQNLTPTAKNLLVEKYQGTPWPYIETIVKSAGVGDSQDFINLVQHFDQIRGQSFSQSHPEIARAMEYYD